MAVGCSFVDPAAVSGVVSRIVARLAGTGRTRPEGITLRETLGIERPAS
jgi:hypothetical protein